MEKMKRTVTCGELTEKEVGRTVVLNGWVHRNRNHGGIHFIDLRDRYGITQIVIDESASQELRELAESLKFEYCIAVKGAVRKRPDSMINSDMKTGDVEVASDEIVVLNTCETLPFMIDADSGAREELRLQYRYLDLRSSKMQKNIRLRHDVTYRTREYLTSQGFLEIETPTLIKSTPEGARDFIVPSRTHQGSVFALPQSPQLFKQILMVSGFDKYFQIPRCYRDEDARGDRQLEFTQIDLEMSYVSKEDIFEVIEGMMLHIFKHTMDIELSLPFKRYSFAEVMNTYGSDKPDLRFGLPLHDFASYAGEGGFQVFKTVIETGGAVKALVAKGCASYSRKNIGELEDAAKIYGAKGLAWMKVTETGLEGGISKFYENQSSAIIKGLEAEPGDLILLIGDAWNTACISLGAVRSLLGSKLDLIDKKVFNFCWVLDYPLFEWNEEGNRWEASHHMFSMPQEKYLDTLEEDPGSVLGDMYDLVCNGYELASGSIRIHKPAIQKQIFKILGFSEEEAMKRFGFLLESFKYGAPPHGGIAPGLDRMIMIMTGSESIREVIPFPKNTAGISPMDGSPSVADLHQLEELGLKLSIKKEQKTAEPDKSAEG
jgi:aspartyl-tRNA synthetase